jgi:hypothetical protein
VVEDARARGHGVLQVDHNDLTLAPCSVPTLIRQHVEELGRHASFVACSTGVSGVWFFRGWE